MSLDFEKKIEDQRGELTSYSPPAQSLRPTPAQEPATDFDLLQYGMGNSAVANAVKETSLLEASNAYLMQSYFGNAAVNRAVGESATITQGNEERTGSNNPSESNTQTIQSTDNETATTRNSLRQEGNGSPPPDTQKNE